MKNVTSPVRERTETNEHEIRQHKVHAMRDQGVEPWPAAVTLDASLQQVKEEFEQQSNKHYAIAGRIKTMREHGKTIFAHLSNDDQELQIYVNTECIGSQAFDTFKAFIDIGDIIFCKGTSFKTKMGEITLRVNSYTLLSKSLHPLPEKFHGLTDVEVRYRQRYLDLLSNTESKSRFRRRSVIIKTIRYFLDEHGFMEVETPMLHPLAGGAAAKPFVTHHNALDADLFLRIAPELYLKRLIVGGFNQVYEINRNFRNEGISTRHNPEFTMLEFYWAHKEYTFIMSFVESLFQRLSHAVNNQSTCTYNGITIDFSHPFARLSVLEALVRYTAYSQKELTENIDTILAQHALSLAQGVDAALGMKLFALFELLVEPQLLQPTFIIDYPIEVSPLAKKLETNNAYAARFELFIGGMEIANGFNELNDPFDQKERFKAQVMAYEAGDKEAHLYDEEYIVSLEHALAPCVGVGIGIDRLTMLLTNASSIKDVILFPTLKRR